MARQSQPAPAKPNSSVSQAKAPAPRPNESMKESLQALGFVVQQQSGQGFVIGGVRLPKR